MRRRNLIVVMVTVVGFLFVSASLCQAEDIVYGCYQKNYGQLRVVENPDECLPSELPVSLSGVKPEGPLPGFEGELCWIAYITEREEGPYEEEPTLVKLGITHTVGPFYSLQGIAAPVEDNEAFLSGSATVLENVVVLSMHLSQDHIPFSPWRDSTIFQAHLDKSTLDGNWWILGLSFNTSSRVFDPDYGAGTMTFTTCP